MAEKRKASAEVKRSANSKASSDKDSRNNAKKVKPLRREIGAFVCLFAAVLLILGMFGVDAVLISGLMDGFRALFGAGLYLAPFVLIFDFFILLFHDGRPVRLRVFCTFAVMLCIGVFWHLLKCDVEFVWKWAILKDLWITGVEGQSGGLLAGLIAEILEPFISRIGAVLLCCVMTVIVTLRSFNMTIVGILRAIRERPRVEYAPPVKEHRDTAEVLVNHMAQRQIDRAERKKARISEFDLPVDEPPAALSKKEKKAKKNDDELQLEEPPKKKRSEVGNRFEEAAVKAMEPDVPLVVKKAEEIPLPPPEPEVPQKVKKEEALQEAVKIASEIAQTEDQGKPYCFPTLHLLEEGDGKTVDGTDEMQINADRINDTLASFGIDAHIINVIRGSSITRYELELDRGVKLSKITNLADDIALSLGASGVRISAIPDKISVVGIEVPNKLVSTVRIHEVISSPEFGKSKSKISFSVGKDISGKCVVGDISKLPHMLIAGTTGSGKSVCMNSLIISLLYKAKPEEVKMIMVDPKMVELGIYNGIPHLLIPVVTDPKKAAGALQWAVTEMMKRYRMMADSGVRDLETYNKNCITEGRETLPQIVVVIDELADLMLVAAKEVEESICRVAQMGRASGIHLVIATQRPSADVITGLMKANIPSRIAFAVASAMESRIILDNAGAEKLVGKGDMLYAPLGQGKPKRVQGCFISDKEVQNVVEFIKQNTSASYDNDVMEQIDKKAEQSGKSAPAAAGTEVEATADGDDLLPAAVEVFLETGQGSVSMLQRRLKLGYARAARIVDEMEEKGIVGPFEGSKPRQLLISKDQWLQMQGLAPEEPAAEENPPVEEEIF